MWISDRAKPKAKPKSGSFKKDGASSPYLARALSEKGGRGSLMSPMRGQVAEGPQINMMELRVAVCLWYYHCATVPVKPHVGCRMLVPFICNFTSNQGNL
jgi:hypothetical protein